MSEESALILLVDDDIDFLESNQLVLESRGYRVACAATPDEALKKIAEGEVAPRLIITDLMMDTLDAGFSFATRLKSDPRTVHVPVMVVTAAESQRGFDFRPRSAEDLSAMNVDAFLSKPVVPKLLLGKVEELLAKAQPPEL